MSEQGYKSSSIDQKTSLLKRYYYEPYEKHYGEGKLFFLFSGIKILPFFFFVWSVSGDKFKDVISIVIGLVSSFIDNSVSDAIKISGHISLAKNVFWMKYWDHYCWH